MAPSPPPPRSRHNLRSPHGLGGGALQVGRRRGGRRPDGDPRAPFATFYGAHALPKTVQQIFNQTNKAPNKKPGFLFNTRRDVPAGAAARSRRPVEPNLGGGGGGAQTSAQRPSLGDSEPKAFFLWQSSGQPLRRAKRPSRLGKSRISLTPLHSPSPEGPPGSHFQPLRRDPHFHSWEAGSTCPPPAGLGRLALVLFRGRPTVHTPLLCLCS